MNAEMVLIDTDETIGEQAVRLAAETTAQHIAIGREYAETARAILATSRRRLTPKEEYECEAAASEEWEFDECVLDRLAVEFAREIGQWKDGVRA